MSAPTNFAANGSTDDAAEPNFMLRILQVKQSHLDETKLLEELFCRYQYLSEQYQKECDARKEDESMRICLYSDPFVLVLIDGDAMLFSDELLEAYDGGPRAAMSLYEAIIRLVQEDFPHIPTQIKVVCRIYANIRGLADKLVCAGIIAEVDTFNHFTLGFTQGHVSFDFVDVGPGKDCADIKIIDSFKHHLTDYRCRQIFLGCADNNLYATTLQYHATEVCLSRVTLLEAVPFEKEMKSSLYRTKKLPGIFREQKPGAYGGQYPFNGNGHTNGNGVAKTYNVSAGLPTRFPPRPLDHPAQFSPLSRTTSNSTLTSIDGTANGVSLKTNGNVTTGFSWAAKAAAPPPANEWSQSPSYKPASREEVVARNRAGQRVDPPCRDYDKNEVDRVKKQKLCNVHFLRGECPYGDKCTHLHSAKPSKDELQVLRLVARLAPCKDGSTCEELKCMYGHRCPAPPGVKAGRKGVKTCIFGEACNFPPELHDIDTNVVKTLVIR